MGPLQYVQHLVSGPRLPFTVAYLGSIALTIYFAVGVSSIYYIILAFLSQRLFDEPPFFPVPTPRLSLPVLRGNSSTVRYGPNSVDGSHANIPFS